MLNNNRLTTCNHIISSTSYGDILNTKNTIKRKTSNFITALICFDTTNNISKSIDKNK